MAEFLTTSGVSDWLERIIKEANSRLILISPYLQVNPKIKKLLQAKNHEIQTMEESRFSKAISIFKGGDTTSKMQVQIIHRRDAVRANEISWLQDLSSIEAISLENLHAKCYLNENHALITSMNLYQHSQVHNYEMGILATRSGGWGDGGSELYKAIVKHAEELITHAKMENPIVGPVRPSPESQANSVTVSAESNAPKRSVGRNRKASTATLERPSTGYCIRCGESIPESAESKPFCAKDWRTWNRFKRDDFAEKFCHFCGQPSETSKGKPLCLDCFRKFKSILNF